MPMEKTFDAASAEPRITQAWEDGNAFAAGANASRDETYCIMIPPPNVTGSLHIGHAFNNTLQDILIRWHRMRGFDTLWQPGTDHAGIATQMVTERDMAANQEPSRQEMGRAAFVDRVWQQKVKSRGTIIGQLKRLGASCDWSREAFTMGGAPGDPNKSDGSPNFHDAVIKVFVDMYDKGMIYRGKRLVNWDPHFETAISDLEVEQIEVNGNMWRLRYALENGETYEHPIEFDDEGNATAFETRDYLTVATTRPETMLGDTGVAVHPDDPRYQHLIGKTVTLPLVNRSIPIVADSYADPEKGTGAVKITPAHDFNDAEVGARTGLRVINVMNTKAGIAVEENIDFLEGCDPEPEAMALHGLDRYEARKRIIALAEDQGWLDGIDADRHMVPHGDRSKVAIEPFLTDQWFVDTSKIVGPALEAVKSGRVKIQPESGEKTYYHWLENIEPWCISRQLWWGHQIPVWYGLNMSLASEHLAEAGVPAGSAEDWDAVDMGAALAFDGLVHGGEHHHCSANLEDVSQKFLDDLAGLPAPLNHAQIVEVADKAEAMDRLAESLSAYAMSQDPTTLVYPVWREADVLDTWFSSGLWPIGTLGWPDNSPEMEKYFPTSVLVTGFDILFFWVARMMMMQLAVVEEVPFDEVYLHGLVRDAKGKKMSKSVGNVVDPLEVIDEFGADALRFSSAAMAALGGVLKLDMERIKGYRNFTTKLWNAARFAEMNAVFEHRGADQRSISDAKQTVNRWIVGETAKVRETVDEALMAYRFNDAANALYAFVWGKVCDWYLEFAKPLFASEDPEIVQETRETMAWVLDQCFILLHPITPFITEELWATTGTREKMCVHADWPVYTSADLVDPEADREMNWVIDLIEQVRSVRAQMRVPVGLYVPVLQLELDAAGKTAYAGNEALIKRLARIEGVTETSEPPKGALTIAVEGGTFALPLADIIDVAEEKARLEKSVAKLEKELGGIRGRLSNDKFLASAPEEVVTENRARLASGEEELSTLKAAIGRLAEVA
ncbi:MAG: valine--tRNA ligase [Dinoroseobacter sp.]|nr:valine--tRNA ligase [Dinoroseobacter sp.]